MEKLRSRKFWICVAAMFASIATSIGGLKSDNEIIVAIGTISGIASAAIYAFCEAWVDSKAVNASNMDSIIRLLDDLASSREEEDGKQSANQCIHCENGTDCHKASEEA